LQHYIVLRAGRIKELLMTKIRRFQKLSKVGKTFESLQNLRSFKGSNLCSLQWVLKLPA